jgi:hypothetical protein
LATQTGPQSAPWKVHVGAFGKHPGWDDHIEDLGIETDRLVQVRRALYSEGIAGNIDAGAWEKLEDDKRLPGFDHTFYWRERDQLVVGRFWSSRDGKGRTKYPMAVCVHAPGAPDDWLFDVVAPRLGTIRDACIAAPNAEGVRAVLAQWKASLQDAATPMPPGASKSVHDAMMLRRLVAAQFPTELGDDATLGLARILYEIDRELAPFRPAPGRSRSTSPTGVGNHLRVPRVLGQPGEDVRAWMALMRQELSPIAPVLVIDALGHPFLDVIVGDVEPSLLFCVRAGAGAVPPANMVPYTIGDEFAAASRAKIAAWSTGQQPPPVPAASRPAVELSAPSVAGLKQWLVPIIGIVLVIIGVLAMIMLSSGGKSAKNGAQSHTQASKPEEIAPGATEPPAPQPPAPQLPTSKSQTDAATQPPAPEPKATTPPPPTRTAEVPPPRDPVNGAPPLAEPAADITRDPRLDWAAAEEFAALLAHLERANAALAEEGVLALTQVRSSIDQERGSVDLLLAQPWSGSNRASIVANVNTARASLAGLRAQIDQALADQRVRLKEQAGAVLAQANVEHPALRAALAQAAGSIDTSRGWATTLNQARSIATLAAEADTQWRGIAAPAAVRGMNAAAIDARVAERTQLATAALAAEAVAADKAKVNAAIEMWRSWCQQATDVTRRVASLDESLRTGLAATDTSTQERAAQLAAAAEELGLGDSVRPTIDRYHRLAVVRDANSAQPLVELIRDSGPRLAEDGPSHTLLAWSRLAALAWPASPADLATAVELKRDSIKPALASIVAQDMRAASERNASAASAQMWSGFLARHSHTPGAVAAAAAHREAMGIASEAVSALPSHARYNIAFEELRIGLAPLIEQADRQSLAEVRQRVQAFVAAQGQVDFAQAASFREKAAELIGRAPVIDLASLGPGAAGWPVTLQEDGVIAFASPVNAGVTLTFRRVARPDGKTAYLAKEELSVAALGAIITASGRAEELRSLMLTPASETNDRRPGPRTWVWSDRAGSERVISSARAGDPTLGWLRTNSDIKPGYYAVDPPPPALTHPANHISPIGALAIARLVGCRLPTKEEWGAAFEDTGAANAAGANLRDRAWSAHATHISILRDTQSAAAAPYPTEGAFWPQGSDALSWEQEREATHSTDDGTLWFMPVEAGQGPFRHLVGNVAEYVFDDWERSDAAPADPARIAELFGPGGQGLFVIGGSALTARQIQVTSPEAVRWSRSRAHGFSDVGVRLAFTAAGADRPAVSAHEWSQLIKGAAAAPPPP